MRDQRPLLIRQPFSGRHDGILWARVFPSVLQLAEQRHPTIESVVEVFAGAGFELQEIQPVQEIAAADLHEYARKIEARADSTLALISDEDFQRGLEKLRHMAEESPAEPVVSSLDLVVLR